MSDLELITVFGDSHVRMFLPHEQLDRFYQNHDNFHDFEYAGYRWRVMKIGSSGATAYGLINEDSETQAGQVIIQNIESTQHLVLFFGEVDVRSHISSHEDPWISVSSVVQRYRTFLEQSVVGQIGGKLIVANSIGHSLDSLRIHGRAALATKVFNHELKCMTRSLGIGYLNVYDMSVDSLGVVPEDNIETDGLLCHIVPDKMRDILRRETVKLVRE